MSEKNKSISLDGKKCADVSDDTPQNFLSNVLKREVSFVPKPRLCLLQRGRPQIEIHDLARYLETNLGFSVSPGWLSFIQAKSPSGLG